MSSESVASSERSGLPEVTQERYYRLIEEAQGIATPETFDVAGFVEHSLLQHDGLTRETIFGEDMQQRLELLVLTGEVLAQGLSHRDTLESADDYELYKGGLSNLTSRQKAFCRSAVSVSTSIASEVLPEKEVLRSMPIDAQLMAILA